MPLPDRLSEATLAALPALVATPAYDRGAVTPGIVHIGVGAFHRAHQAVYVDDCLAAGERDWGIIGASLQSAGTATALNRQDGLYTLAVRDGSGEALRVVGAIGSILVAPRDPGVLLDALVDPRIRIVTLTVTEKAYLRDASGDLDAAHPDIVADLADPARPKTVHGFLVEALARRRTAGVQPFAILSCDNLPANGETLHRLLVQFAALRDAALAGHVRSVSCPSSMVDRIVPATTDADRQLISATLGLEDAWPVVTEPYSQWVVEENFPSGRPAWERSGVTMVRDISPFEDMKLRLLNGAHSAIACLGLLSGHDTVAKSFGDPAIRGFVQALWSASAATLPRDAGLDSRQYIANLTRRFDNPALAHRTTQIATDSSQKLPQRIVAPALDRLAAGRTVHHLIFVIAAWIHAAESRGIEFPAGHFTDPLDASGLFTGQSPAEETVRAVFDAAGFATGSIHRAALQAAASIYLETLREAGIAAALAQLPTQGEPA